MMKKSFKYYFACFAILLALFNVICFVTPDELLGMSKFGGAFWVGYVFITLAFVGQLVCAYIAFGARDLQRFFYNLPLVTISYGGLSATLIIGAFCMMMPGVPNYVAVIACLLVLAFNAVAIIKASAAADMVENTDNRIKAQTGFIKTLTSDIENLIAHAKSDQVRSECQKVYEAVRYSDPVSSDALADIEANIKVRSDALANSVDADDAGRAAETAAEVIALIKTRNSRCKALK